FERLFGGRHREGPPPSMDPRDPRYDPRRDPRYDPRRDPRYQRQLRQQQQQRGAPQQRSRQPAQRPARQAPRVPAEPPLPKVTAKPKDPNAYKVLVLGDFLGKSLASGLEETFAETPMLAVVERTDGSSGFVRTDHFDWNAALPDILN